MLKLTGPGSLPGAALFLGVVSFVGRELVFPRAQFIGTDTVQLGDPKVLLELQRKHVQHQRIQPVAWTGQISRTRQSLAM